MIYNKGNNKHLNFMFLHYISPCAFYLQCMLYITLLHLYFTYCPPHNCTYEVSYKDVMQLPYRHEMFRDAQPCSAKKYRCALLHVLYNIQTKYESVLIHTGACPFFKCRIKTCGRFSKGIFASKQSYF
jgi:hypothetical protein